MHLRKFSSKEYTRNMLLWSPWVVLTLNAIDNNSKVAQMSFSIDGENWNAWINFKNTLSFKLDTGDGEKIIYFRVKDRAGNIAEPVSDTILLDTTSLEPEDHTSEKPSFNIVPEIIISIVIIIIIIILIILIIKRKKRSKQKTSPSENIIEKSKTSHNIKNDNKKV